MLVSRRVELKKYRGREREIGNQNQTPDSFMATSEKVSFLNH